MIRGVSSIVILSWLMLSCGVDTMQNESVINIGDTNQGNGTDGNKQDVVPVNEECLWFRKNPYWRLTATDEQRRKYICVCYNMCFTPELINYYRNISVFNYTEIGVCDRNTFFMFYLTFAMYLLVIVFGAIGNIVVIVGILFVMNDKTVFNRFVVSLAVADLFLSVFITPIKLLYQLEVMTYMTVTWICKIMLYLRQLAQTETIVILTIIAFERYYAICHPLKAKFRCSMKRCHILIGISWVVALVIALPSVISAAHYVYFLAILLLIPTTIMSFAYGTICFVLWKSSKKVSQMTNRDGKSDKIPPELKARVKVIKTMIGLLVVFIVCWGPRLILNTVWVFYLNLIPIVNVYADLLVELLANSHSLINPAMFILFSQPFRKAFVKRYPRLCCWFSALKRTARSSVVSGQTVSATDGQTNGYSTTSNNHI